MVDDDREDVYLTKRAFCGEHADLVFNSTSTGSELFEYLNRQGKFSDSVKYETPHVILLDVNIPRENGFDILQRLRADSVHNYLPVVMLTTSYSENDIRKAYSLGANSYLCKSINANGMKQVAAQFFKYWFEFAKLPSRL